MSSFGLMVGRKLVFRDGWVRFYMAEWALWEELDVSTVFVPKLKALGRS